MNITHSSCLHMVEHVRAFIEFIKSKWLTVQLSEYEYVPNSGSAFKNKTW